MSDTPDMAVFSMFLPLAEIARAMAWDFDEKRLCEETMIRATQATDAEGKRVYVSPEKQSLLGIRAVIEQRLQRA